MKARNGAGIKADKAWRAARKPVYNKSSVEHVGNRNVKRVSAFRKYSSTKAFLKDYAKKIREDYPQSAKQKDIRKEDKGRLSAVREAEGQRLALFRGALQGTPRQMGDRPQLLFKARHESGEDCAADIRLKVEDEAALAVQEGAEAAGAVAGAGRQKSDRLASWSSASASICAT